MASYRVISALAAYHHGVAKWRSVIAKEMAQLRRHGARNKRGMAAKHQRNDIWQRRGVAAYRNISVKQWQKQKQL